MGVDERPRHPSVKEMAYVIFKRKGTILTVFALILAGVLLGVLLTRPTYEASALLLIKRERGELVVSPHQGQFANMRWNADQDLRSEAELVKRRSLLASVVQTLGPATVLAGRLPTPGQPQTEAPAGQRIAHEVKAIQHAVLRPANQAVRGVVELFRPRTPVNQADQAIYSLEGATRIAAIDQSNLIRVTFTAEDPRFATTVLNMLVTNYLDHYAQLRSTPGTVAFFESEMQTLAKNLRGAEEELRRFSGEHDVSAPTRQRELYLMAGLDRENALQTARSEVAELREKSRLLRAQLEELPEKTRSEEQLRMNPNADRLRSKLLELEIERNKLLQKYTNEDRRVTDLEREITLLRDRFTSESPWELAHETYSENRMRQPLLLELLNTEGQLVRSEVRAKSLQHDLAAWQSRLKTLDWAATERSRQERKVKMLEDAYLLFVKKYEEARISAAMDQNRIVNVALAEPPHVDPKPGGGSKIAFLGAIVGLMSGVGLAFVREYFSNAFTTDESVRRHLGLPVLAAVSDSRR